ncbi:hypothetical protein VE26_08800 [Devosia chinhatensis]|uniref:CsgH-like domain-containing protein n=2 Tax=Devosia chinhatensis TaxID=429727 RepID=A0A0F5FLX9_9HYPH|nr:hypothetical protein VE26_08800 [Devosia chinhatensis]
MPFTLGVIALLALGGAALAGSGNPAPTQGGVSCGVATRTAHGMTTFQGVVEAPGKLIGDYRFALVGKSNGGSSTISQGGPFSIEAGTSTILGQASLNADARVDIDFTVTAKGQTYDCSQRLTAQS